MNGEIGPLLQLLVLVVLFNKLSFDVSFVDWFFPLNVRTSKHAFLGLGTERNQYFVQLQLKSNLV